jgi:REP element-mobilizing transposase RayT
MTEGLHRFYGGNDLHFLTSSCYRRRPLFRNQAYCDLFLKILDRVRRRYRFVVLGYVVMPEHVHLLVSEPQRETLSTAIQALKLGVVRSVQCSGSVVAGAPRFAKSARPGAPSPPGSQSLWLRFMAPQFILANFGKRGFMISMFGRSASGLKRFAISIATRFSAGWCVRLSSGAGAVFDGNCAERTVRCGSMITDILVLKIRPCAS